MHTDLLLYKERSELLVPDINEENRFLIESQGKSIVFMIGSTSEGQYLTLKAFFERLYSIRIERCDTPDRFLSGRILLNGRRNGRKTDFYYPSFVRNLVNLPSMLPELRLQYQAVIRSSISLLGHKRYSFAVLIGYTGNTESAKTVEGYLKQETARMRKRFGWKLRMKKSAGRLRPSVLRESFVLSSFVRVPFDEEGG